MKAIWLFLTKPRYLTVREFALVLGVLVVGWVGYLLFVVIVWLAIYLTR